MIVPNRGNTCVLFLDLQENIVGNSRTRPLPRLAHSAGKIAQLAALHKLPTFLSSVERGGKFLPAIMDVLPGVEAHPRVRTSAFEDAGLTAALKATGRNVVILSGVASEIVVCRTALDAIAAGYSVYVAIDACGGIDARTEDAAWRRVVAAGGAISSSITFAAELTEDFTTAIGGQTLGIMYELIADAGR